MVKDYTKKLTTGLNNALEILHLQTDFEPIHYAIIASDSKLEGFTNRDKYAIIAHIVNDGFAGIHDEQSVPSQAKYYITVEGIIQLKNGGYTTIFEERKKTKRHSKQNRIISFIAVGVSILALALSCYTVFKPSSSIYILSNSNTSPQNDNTYNKVKEKPIKLQEAKK